MSLRNETGNDKIRSGTNEGKNSKMHVTFNAYPESPHVDKWRHEMLPLLQLLYVWQGTASANDHNVIVELKWETKQWAAAWKFNFFVLVNKNQVFSVYHLMV